MNKEIYVELKNACKSYKTDEKNYTIFYNVNLGIYKNECFCILGHSGCGKSTLLRSIVGIEKLDQGQILVDSVERRKPGKDVILLFQDFNQLFPWKTVLENVVQGLLVTKICENKKSACAQSMDILNQVGLADYASFYPHQLSGGMKQRGAVARALSLHPRVLLMDEPFANLDEKNRFALQVLTKRICEEHNITNIFVTHSIDEAFIMADRIAVMGDDGRGIIKIYEKEEWENNRLAVMDEILQLLVASIDY